MLRVAWYKMSGGNVKKQVEELKLWLKNVDIYFEFHILKEEYSNGRIKKFFK